MYKHTATKQMVVLVLVLVVDFMVMVSVPLGA